MADSKKFLIISLITSFIYVVLGLALMLIKKLDTVSVILFALIILVALVSSTLCWKIMHDENKGKTE